MIADEKLQNLLNDLQDDLGPSPRWQELEDAIATTVDYVAGRLDRIEEQAAGNSALIAEIIRRLDV